jgi:hypothetical protein
MEINAVLEKHGLAKSGLWYVLSPENEGPSARVGHACCVLKTSANILKDCPDNQNSDSLLIIGGANPDGAFDDVYILDFGEIHFILVIKNTSILLKLNLFYPPLLPCNLVPRAMPVRGRGRHWLWRNRRTEPLNLGVPVVVGMHY